MYQFNNAKKEITIKKSNPPTPWMNYLSNGTFHTMMSQAGGGVAFYKSPQIWRINHYRFFHLPTDRSGFYTYIKDADSVWCPTAEPVEDRPDSWQATHGMGYTRFEAERKGLSVTANYFVGPFENCLIWNLTFKSETDRHITLFPYVELGMMEFMRELQWQCYSKHQLECYNLDDILVYEYGVETQPKPDETPLIYFATNQPVAAFDCDRDEFIGGYRSEENPQRVESGHCSNSTMCGGDPCFALEIPVDLKAGEEKTVNIFLGAAMTEEDIKKAVAHCREADFVEKSYIALGEHWTEHLDKFKAELPDKDAETMINIWNPYQAERNFQFSRNISYYATGTFRGTGVRDTAQDILAMVPFNLRRAKDKLNLLFGQQYQDGHTNHYCFPNEGWEPLARIHSDNHLWLIMTTYHIVMEEGTLDYLDEVIPYYDGGEATVWEHIKKSVDYTKEHCGEHGFPLMLASDWNDMLFKVCQKGKGESIWTGMQFGTVLRQIAELARLKGESDALFNELYEEQKKLVNEVAWDGKWFRRCITDDGRFIGSDKEPQAKVWLNSQSWAVLSGMGDGDKQVQAMDSVREYLNTDIGIKKIHPSMKHYPTKEDPLTYDKPGCSENGSIFCHANTWAIIAECMLGRADRAYEYYHQLLPMIAQKKVGEWRYKAEPYVYSSNIFGPESDKFGLANVSWLSGTAAWMYIAATQYMLGIKPKWEGIEISPCLSKEMLPAKVTRVFRGVKLNITIKSNKKVFVPIDGKEKEMDIIVE
ncbi:MAG: hypothetical protein IKL80_05760 [Clostridia bacterium]|nr:hypothetical protein [Clostridia bacterium]